MHRKTVFAALLSTAVLLGGCGGSVSINDDTLRLSIGQEQTVSVKADKDDEIRFLSADPNIASVDENGTVTALGDGITVITARGKTSFDNVAVVVGTGVASYVDENGNIVSSLTASAADDSLISGESNITALSISIVGGGTEDVTISTDREYELNITKTPLDSTDKVILSIADGSVARIDGNTLVGVSPGKTTLTATAPNGVSAEMIVRVR